mmetsp:Transcript_5538/g.10971  ORF Transcript_5538/g.10971 Transcript_5538/m.10971 type:complete len:108 (-) Transcript_5538:49-372(-)
MDEKMKYISMYTQAKGIAPDTAMKAGSHRKCFGGMGLLSVWTRHGKVPLAVLRRPNNVPTTCTGAQKRRKRTMNRMLEDGPVEDEDFIRATQWTANHAKNATVGRKS